MDDKPHIQRHMLWSLVMLADVMPNLIVHGRCCAKVWQILCKLTYGDRCYVLNNLPDVMQGVIDGMATVVRVVYFN